MIPANELRIGNWVYGFKTTYYIDSNDFKYVDSDTGLIPFSPILLTEEILLKCGFEKHSNSNEFWNLYTLKNGWYISQALHEENSASVKMGLFYWSDEYVELQYLHQLQNLYFALTKKELNIQL
jgi:hypothetical protein